MKRLLIASIVGTIILFVSLAILHVAPTFHYSDYKYTPAQDSIIHSLSANLKEDGFYFVPYYPEGTTMSEMHNLMQSRLGQPYALINYHSQLTENYMVLLMSFIYNFISMLIICAALAAASSKLSSFGQHLWFVMLFALFTIFANTMMRYNWEGYPMHYLKGQILDTIVGYFLAGLWLAWYYVRLERRKA